MRALLILILAILVLNPAFALAEQLWKCPSGKYTNAPSDKEKCTPVQAGRICGDGGNKFFAPGTSANEDPDAPCEPAKEGEATSPFVNYAKVKAAKEKKAAKKRRKSKSRKKRRVNTEESEE